MLFYGFKFVVYYFLMFLIKIEFFCLVLLDEWLDKIFGESYFLVILIDCDYDVFVFLKCVLFGVDEVKVIEFRV